MLEVCSLHFKSGIEIHKKHAVIISLSSFILKYFAIILIANLTEFAFLRVDSTC